MIVFKRECVLVSTSSRRFKIVYMANTASLATTVAGVAKRQVIAKPIQLTRQLPASRFNGISHVSFSHETVEKSLNSLSMLWKMSMYLSILVHRFFSLIQCTTDTKNMRIVYFEAILKWIKLLNLIQHEIDMVCMHTLTVR